MNFKRIAGTLAICFILAGIAAALDQWLKWPFEFHHLALVYGGMIIQARHSGSTAQAAA